MKKLVFSLGLRFVLTVCILLSPAARALDGSLNIGAIISRNWKLEGVNIALSSSSKNQQKLTLIVKKLTLPKPFDDFKFINIHCAVFSWQNSAVLCEQGRVKIHSKRWQSPSAVFAFRIGDKRSSFKLTNLRLARGLVSITGKQQGDQWRIQVDANSVDGALMGPLLQTGLVELSGGKVSFKLNALISHQALTRVALTARLDELTAQTKDGRFATEKLTLKSSLNAQNSKGLWQWQSHSRVDGGAFYAEPVYLETGGQGIILDTVGSWNPANKAVAITSLNYQHSQTATLNGSVLVYYGKGLAVEQANLSLRSDDLPSLSSSYLKPFFQQTSLEGLSFAGRLTADFAIAKQSLTALSAIVERLEIKDAAGRLSVHGGAGVLNWSNNEAFTQTSSLAWQQLQIHNLPIGPAKLLFSGGANAFKLTEKAHLPFLGGLIAINQFAWRVKKQQEPEISFAGDLSNVSLEKLSTALGWTPLSGYISGKIPKVDYSNNTLSLGGELIINVFDGTIKVTKLASSGLLTDFPTVYGELDIDNLDLDQITSKFEFGRITGRLSGFVRQLTLENWRPVAFYAWLGTPENDDSSHKISQKAVKNIASIGGGGVSDLVSRSFLNLFETFSYDKIGIGCYLHDGMCQLMGVEAVNSGYSIVKGGGLPRIDVIGYNPQLDWNVLMERLSRIATTDEVIIE